MARKRSRKSGGGAKDSGATIDKIERYEDTIEKGGVDDCECISYRLRRQER